MTPPPAPRATPAVLALRAGVVLCVVAAALGAVAPSGEGASPVLAVLDVSASMPTEGEPLAGETGEDRLVFADGVRLARRGEALSGLPRGRTRLADALRAASDLLGDSPGVAWLATDGLDTEGGAVAAARALAARGHRLEVSAPGVPRADVAVHGARAESAGTGAPVTVRVRVVASVAGRVRVELRRAGVVADAEEVPVRPGESSDLVLRDAAPPAEACLHEVALVPLDGTPDDDPENDRVALLARGAEPVVVVLDREPWGEFSPGGPRPLWLDALGPEALDGADLAVLSGLPWRRLDDGGAERLARHVAAGGALLVLGGPDAWGPGGWRGTALERWLPLRTPPPEPGDTLVAVALDHSGSTGEPGAGGSAPSLPALAQALARLLAGLPPDAKALALGFSAVPDGAPLAPGWVRGGDMAAREALVAAAGRLVAAGGTDLDAAVEAAAVAVGRGGDARRRQVLLMTDGDPDHDLTGAEFPRARAALRAAGAEFAAVVRGDARAAQALRALAARPQDVVVVGGAGDFPEALVAAFHRAQERDEVVEGPFAVEAASATPQGAAFGALRPSRVHRLEAAPDAEVLATWRREGEAAHPLAASRRVGLGTVVAVAAGPAHEPPAARESFRAALSPVVAWLGSVADRGWDADLDAGRAEVRAPSGLGSLRVSSPDGETEADLLETAPGVYAGPWPSWASQGPAFAQARGQPRRPLRAPARPPPEHRGAGVDTALLRALAAASGGRLLAPGEAPRPAPAPPRTPLAPVLLLLAGALLVAERALALPRRRSGGRTIGGP